MWNWTAQKTLPIFSSKVPGDLWNGSAHILSYICFYNFCKHSRRGCYGNDTLDNSYWFAIVSIKLAYFFIRCQLSSHPSINMLFRAAQFPSAVWLRLWGKGGQSRLTRFPVTSVKQFFLSTWLAADTLAAIWHFKQKNESREYREKELSVLVVLDLLSPFSGNQEYLQMTTEAFF